MQALSDMFKISKLAVAVFILINVLHVLMFVVAIPIVVMLYTKLKLMGTIPEDGIIPLIVLFGGGATVGLAFSSMKKKILECVVPESMHNENNPIVDEL